MAEQQKTLGAGALVNAYTAGDATILVSPAAWPDGVPFSTSPTFSVGIRSGPGPAYPAYTVTAVTPSAGNFILAITLEAGTDNSAAAGTRVIEVSTSRSLDARYVRPIVSIADGGTGTATPSLVAGSGIAVTGSWPNQMIASTGGGGGGGFNPTTQTDVTGSRTLDTVFQNLTDFPIWINVDSFGLVGADLLQGLSDSSNPPTDVVSSVLSSVTGVAQVGFIVLPGNFYSIGFVGGGGALSRWIEWSGGGGGTAAGSNLFGPFASLPAAVEGSRYSTSDSVYEFVGVTGPAWQGLFRGQAVTLPAPVSDWTAVNGAGSTVDDSKGEITVSAPVPTDMTFNARLLVKAAPAAPYTARLLITAQFPIVVGGGGQWDSMAGLVFRDSVTGKFVSVQFGTRFDRTDLLEIRVVTWNNVNNPVANVMLFSIAAPMNFLWLQGGDDSTNRFGEFSTDGITWVRFYNEPNTTFITADQVGFFGQATTNGGSSPVFSFTATSWTLG